MACKGIELAVGQIWLTRGGEKVEITGNDGHDTYPWDTECGSLTNDGENVGPGSPSTWDLDKIIFNPQSLEGKYTVEEVLDGAVTVGLWQWDGDGPEEKTATYKSIEDKIKEKQDPEYAKYLELKAKFEK